MVCVLTRSMIDILFSRRGCWTYVVSKLIFPLHSLRKFLTNSIVLPFTYNKSCDVFDSIGYGTPALYWVHDIAIRSAFPMSSHGVLQFCIKCCTPEAPIVFLNE